jgi:hypothetical protein
MPLSSHTGFLLFIHGSLLNFITILSLLWLQKEELEGFARANARVSMAWN